MITFYQRTHSTWYKVSLNGHKKSTFSTGTLLELLRVLYVDDGAFHFGNRAQLEQGVELIYSHFTKFGLEMHIGREGKPSNTECVSPPPPWILQVTPETSCFKLGNRRQPYE